MVAPGPGAPHHADALAGERAGPAAPVLARLLLVEGVPEVGHHVPAGGAQRRPVAERLDAQHHAAQGLAGGQGVARAAVVDGGLHLQLLAHLRGPQLDPGGQVEHPLLFAAGAEPGVAAHAAGGPVPAVGDAGLGLRVVVPEVGGVADAGVGRHVAGVAGDLGAQRPALKLAPGAVDRQPALRPARGVQALAGQQGGLLVLVAAGAEGAVRVVAAQDAAHARVEHVGEGPEGQRCVGAKRLGGDGLRGTQDAQATSDAGVGGVQVHGLDLVAGVAVDAGLVGLAAGFEQVAAPERSVDARRVAVRAGAGAGCHPPRLVAGGLLAAVVERREHALAEVAAHRRLPGARLHPGAPVAPERLAVGLVARGAGDPGVEIVQPGVAGRRAVRRGIPVLGHRAVAVRALGGAVAAVRRAGILEGVGGVVGGREGDQLDAEGAGLQVALREGVAADAGLRQRGGERQFALDPEVQLDPRAAVFAGCPAAARARLAQERPRRRGTVEQDLDPQRAGLGAVPGVAGVAVVVRFILGPRAGEQQPPHVGGLTQEGAVETRRG